MFDFMHRYPYNDFHELNLDWIIETINKIADDMKNFIHSQTIKIANPITWDINRPYESNTIVYFDGVAYLSKKPVNGEYITNTDYWQKIYVFSFFNDNMINVKECGAIGDGIHDDTQSIRQALIVGEGKTIYFPEGTYLIDGITIPRNTMLLGFNMQSTIIKLKDGSSNHVIEGGDFDINADGVKKSLPLGCYSSVIQGLTIDGNKENCPDGKGGIMIYGFNLQLTQVTVRNCNTYGIYLESPGNVFSLDVGINLQDDLTNLTIYNCNDGELVYNGQSDSNIYNVLCYGDSNANDYVHAHFKSKSNGTRIFGLHTWGNCAISCLNEGIKTYFYNCHFETARDAQFKTTTSTTFNGHVYLNGLVNDSVGVLLDGSGANTCMLDFRSSGIKYPLKLGTNGGHHVINFKAYYSGVDGEIIVGNYNSTMDIECEMWGGTNQRIINTFGTRHTDTVDEHILANDVNYRVRTQGQSIPSFGVENIENNVTSYVGVSGGASSIGPSIMVRGTEENADLRLVPKGDGMIRFGERVEEVVSSDTTIKIKTSDGHTVKLLAKYVE